MYEIHNKFKLEMDMADALADIVCELLQYWHFRLGASVSEEDVTYAIDTRWGEVLSPLIKINIWSA